MVFRIRSCEWRYSDWNDLIKHNCMVTVFVTMTYLGNHSDILISTWETWHASGLRETHLYTWGRGKSQVAGTGQGRVPPTFRIKNVLGGDWCERPFTLNRERNLGVLVWPASCIHFSYPVRIRVGAISGTLQIQICDGMLCFDALKASQLEVHFLRRASTWASSTCPHVELQWYTPTVL